MREKLQDLQTVTTSEDLASTQDEWGSMPRAELAAHALRDVEIETDRPTNPVFLYPSPPHSP